MWIWSSCSTLHLRLSPSSTLACLHIFIYALAPPSSPIHIYSLVTYYYFFFLLCQYFPSFLALKILLQKFQLPSNRAVHIVTYTSLHHISFRLARPQRS